jgi:hypothetical protein
MMRVDELLEQVEHLPVTERRQLAERILANVAQAEHASVPADVRLRALDQFLELAGTAQSEFTDVSADKYKHLADVYADER